MSKYGALGQEIYKHLKRLGWTQKELAHRAKMSQGNISKLMRGEHRATPDTLNDIGKVLGVDPTHLMRLAGIPLPKEKIKRNPEIEQLAQRLDELQPDFQPLALSAIRNQLDAMLFLHKKQQKTAGRQSTSRTITDEEVLASMKREASRDVLKLLRRERPEAFDEFAGILQAYLQGQENGDNAYTEDLEFA